jgi:AcrR family transcriptional regulator
MSKNNSQHTWIEAGYEQFAAEGLEGIQVERLARITGLNKSGYYHYFGDRDSFLEKLMEHHLQLAIHMANDLKQVQQFDPEFIEALIKHKTPVMAHNQLVRNRHDLFLLNTYHKINDFVDPIASKIFSGFIGFNDDLEFSTRYYHQVRDMFYSHITFGHMNYPALRDFMHEAREVIQRAVELAKKTKTV